MCYLHGAAVKRIWENGPTPVAVVKLLDQLGQVFSPF